jgi:hypothetical protein
LPDEPEGAGGAEELAVDDGLLVVGTEDVGLLVVEGTAVVLLVELGAGVLEPGMHWE